MLPDNHPPDSPSAKPTDIPTQLQLDETTRPNSATSTSAAQAAENTASKGWVGKKLGKYQVSAVLGKGAMGIVLKARDPLIDRDVAIKVLAEHLGDDAAAQVRFLAEARAAGKIIHANVIAIHEIIEEGDAFYLVLEYVGGGSLAERLSKQAALPVVEATRAIIDACKGVGAAHAAGLVHRDIKPANLMQTGEGSIKVADFGLAKAGADSNRTQTGTVVGTPFFMSPEQCEARPLDPRSDIYALGATYYTLLTGNKPYQETESVAQLMYLHCHGPILDPRSIDSSIPEACARIIAKAMAKVTGARYQSTQEMLADLQAVVAALSTIVLPSDSGDVPAKPVDPSPPLSSRSATVLTPISSAAASPKGRRAGLVWAAIVLGGMAVGIGAVLWLTGFFGPEADKGQTPPAPAGASGEIVLGMTAPFSGPSSELGREMEIGIRTYLSHVNDEGGVAGRKIRLVSLDDGYEPDRARANMEELYSKHKVFGVIGNVGTPTAEKTVPFALEKQMIYFGGFTGAPLLRRDPPDRFVFNYRASYEEETAAICKYFVDIKRIRPEHIAVFAQQDGYGDAGMRG